MPFPLEFRQHYKANKQNKPFKKIEIQTNVYVDDFYWSRGKQFAVHELPS